MGTALTSSSLMSDLHQLWSQKAWAGELLAAISNSMTWRSHLTPVSPFLLPERLGLEGVHSFILQIFIKRPLCANTVPCGGWT